MQSSDNFVVVDLREHYDEALLRKYYTELMVPNFGMFSDELEDVSVWAKSLSGPKQGPYILHVLLVFERADVKRENLVAGCNCEYYQNSNAGLLTYFAVGEKWKKRGIGALLIKNVLSAMQAEAGGKLDALFLETNDNEKVDAKRDVMDPQVRHFVLQSLGFRILRFQYVQPALSEEQQKCKDLLLAVHQQFVPLRSEVLQRFIREFFVVLMGEGSVSGEKPDEDYLAQITELKKVQTVPVRDFEKK